MHGLSHFWAAATASAARSRCCCWRCRSAPGSLILWKGWVLRRARRDIARAVPAFWDAATLDEGRARLAALDREHVLLPLLDAAAAQPAARHAGTARGRLTRNSRGACATRCIAAWRTCSSARCCWPRSAARRPSSACSAPSGASTTRWSASPRPAASRIDKVAGPVGEALIMTAAGLAVAIPAVLAYNRLGKWVGRLRGRTRRLCARPARDVSHEASGSWRRRATPDGAR